MYINVQSYCSVACKSRETLAELCTYCYWRTALLSSKQFTFYNKYVPRFLATLPLKVLWAPCTCLWYTSRIHRYNIVYTIHAVKLTLYVQGHCVILVKTSHPACVKSIRARVHSCKLNFHTTNSQGINMYV